MAYSLIIKEKAIRLRKRGYSIKEVSDILGIAKSTSSMWLRNIKLSRKGEKRLIKRKIFGQYKAIKTRRQKREKIKEKFNDEALDDLGKIEFDQNLYRLVCSILFWTEGSKNLSSITFVNSDPKMAKIFIKLLRLSFSIDQKKLRAFVHIHEYHNDRELKKFWSDITGIPLTQFTRSYKKPHTEKRKREGYMGCVVIRYYDYKIALKLSSLYNMFSSKI